VFKVLKQVYSIEKNGFLKEIYVAEFDTLGNPTGEIIKDIIIIDMPQGLYKPKWTGTEWIEGMPQIDIDALNNILQPPTPLEIVQTKVAEIEITTSQLIDALAVILEVDA